MPRADLEKLVSDYDNEKVLRQAVQEIQDHLNRQSQQDTR